jgi:hypothetical protein
VLAGPCSSRAFVVVKVSKRVVEESGRFTTTGKKGNEEHRRFSKSNARAVCRWLFARKIGLSVPGLPARCEAGPPDHCIS